MLATSRAVDDLSTGAPTRRAPLQGGGMTRHTQQDLYKTAKTGVIIRLQRVMKIARPAPCGSGDTQ